MHIIPASRVLLANGHFKRVPHQTKLGEAQCAWRIQKPFDLENDSPTHNNKNLINWNHICKKIYPHVFLPTIPPTGTINREIWGIPEITTKLNAIELYKMRTHKPLWVQIPGWYLFGRVRRVPEIFSAVEVAHIADSYLICSRIYGPAPPNCEDSSFRNARKS
ncbi:hypothetical protein CEXT_78981 [Caerostris extrusa]|uniref:Uncharacterized protein n=1 Tax=Caerostris extrusa TaxID=172846 RepID=A0AAV4PNG9_CAEEX|nr:hypothetical protein CEXT_78981 [Caerostris extrusa]